MTPEQYHLAFPRTLSNPLGIDLVHAGVGLGTETFELEQAIRNNDRANTLEELSDIHWYDDLLVAVLMRTSARKAGLSTLLGYPDVADTSMFSLRAAVADIQDVGKRVFWYGLHIEDEGKQLVPRLQIASAVVRGIVRHMCAELSVDLGTLRERNIAKLYQRSPGSFDGLAFVNRDLATEYKLFADL